MSSQIQTSVQRINLLVCFSDNKSFSSFLIVDSVYLGLVQDYKNQHFNIIKHGIICYFCIFIVFFSSKNISAFVLSLYRTVVRFLLAPTCKTLAFFTNLSMLQRCFMFGTKPNKKSIGCRIRLTFVRFYKFMIIFI